MKFKHNDFNYKFKNYRRFKGICGICLVNNNKILLFASFLYLKIGFTHKLRFKSQKHSKDTRNQKNIFFLFFTGTVKNAEDLNNPALN